jgi:hypothetical protein
MLMFVQILQGRCHDTAGAHRLMDRWVSDLGSAATGWLGTTAGATDDGELIAIVRFASEADARANSDRPEQGAWWAEFTKHFDDDVAVHDCPETEAWLGGGSDDAGFVQVIQAQVIDRDRARSVISEMSSMDPQEMGRPDVIGGTICWHSDDDGMTQAVYFTSEAEARTGESSQAPEQAQEQMESFAGAFGEPRYLDLTQPWLYGPS